MHKGKMDGVIIKQLYQSLLHLETEDECEKFLGDLCTVTEINALAQRLEVARLINEGHTYDEIERITGASTATISRIKRFLHHGNGGYKTILERV